MIDVPAWAYAPPSHAPAARARAPGSVAGGAAAPLAVYGAALRRAATGQPARIDVLDRVGRRLAVLDASAWCGGLMPGDRSLLSRCGATTLDVGCGSGRLAAALHGSGRRALGVDVSAEAVRQTRGRGVPAIRADILGPRDLPGAWVTILLADGNIGIGGDPELLLRRCAALLDDGGRVLAEVRSPGEPNWSAEIILSDGHRHSAPFPWASVSVDQIRRIADSASLRILDLWSVAGRWFAELRADHPARG